MAAKQVGCFPSCQPTCHSQISTYLDAWRPDGLFCDGHETVTNEGRHCCYFYMFELSRPLSRKNTLKAKAKETDAQHCANRKEEKEKILRVHLYNNPNVDICTESA